MKNARNTLMAQVAGLQGLETEVEKIVEDVTPEIVEELVADKVAEEVKAEVKELADEVEDMAEQVEEIDEQVEELEECVEGMESLLKAGAYNGAAFGILYARAEKLNAKLGGKETGAVVGAEALGDATSAGLAARAGIEGFTDTVKGYGAAAVNFIKSLYDTLINFLKGLFDKSVALENQAKATKARLEKHEGELKKDVKPGKWAALAKVTRFDKIRDLMGAVNRVVEGGSKLAANDVAGWATAYSAMANKLRELGSIDASKASKSGDQETITVKIGAAQLVAVVYTGDVKTHDDVKKACKVTNLSYEAAKQEGEVSFTAHTKESANKALDQVLRMAKEMNDWKGDKAADEKGRDELISAIKKAETKDEDWTKPAINGIKATTAMTNKVYTTCAKLFGAVADAKIASVKAYL